jgi:hypothetical protein
MSERGPRACEDCLRVAAGRAHLFHPDSDVGPWDEACPACRHLHPNCPTCSGGCLGCADGKPRCSRCLERETWYPRRFGG